MASLPGGDSASVQSRRQVMVVEEDPERCRQLCETLAHHGLSVRAPHATDLAMEVQGWPGIVLVENRDSTERGWELAQRIRTFNRDVPIILLGNGYAPPIISPSPVVQAYLPQETSEEDLLNEVERWLIAAQPPTARRLPGTILLVEDEPRMRNIMKDFLELNGFTVMAVGSGEEALAQLNGALPRVVLLDVKMPGMDGLTTLRHLRMRHPNLPVIFTTQVDEEATMAEAAILGANDYLIKPFNFEHLKNILLLKIFT